MVLRVAPVQRQLWDFAMLRQWAAAIAPLSLPRARMGLAGPHDVGTEFIQKVLHKSLKVWLAHTKGRTILIKASYGPRGMMALALWELQLHQRAERQAVPRETLGYCGTAQVIGGRGWPLPQMHRACS